MSFSLSFFRSHGLLFVSIEAGIVLTYKFSDESVPEFHLIEKISSLFEMTISCIEKQTSVFALLYAENAYG